MRIARGQEDLLQAVTPTGQFEQKDCKKPVSAKLQLNGKGQHVQELPETEAQEPQGKYFKCMYRQQTTQQQRLTQKTQTNELLEAWRECCN